MAEEPPRVSAVIDNYNYGRFLRQCLDSVLAQDYPGGRLEVVLVDDGSNDDSLKVAQDYAGRVKLISQRNQGQSEAFNAGIRASSGELVMFLDADDYWDADKVRTIAAQFRDPSVGVVQHPLRDVDNAGRVIKSNLLDWPPRYTIKDYLDGGVALAAASGLALRRSVLDQIGPIPKEIAFAADAYMIVHGLLVADAANVSEFKGYHRIHGANNWAGNYGDPRKLRVGLEFEKAFQKHLEPKLKARGLEYSPTYKLLDDLETTRRRVLLDLQEGRKRQAFAAWAGLFRRRGLTRLGFFRCATLLMAFLSPALYLRLHGAYRVNHWLVRLRGRVLP